MTFLRHALSDESTRNSIVGGSWVKDGFVPEDELIEHFTQLLSRLPKEKQVESVAMDSSLTVDHVE